MHKPLLKKLLFICACMFAFAFALVPLYSVLCKVTGINGKVVAIPAAAANQVDDQREVGVEFITQVDHSIPWLFSSTVDKVSVHPGEMKTIDFRVENPTNENMVAQAIPSISPGQAAEHFKKMDCFCFTQQPLQAHESKMMRLQFYIDPALPKEFNTVTLSYTLYKVNPADQH
jgi:cytochrome c oxidase assembly protein subunit 11